MRVAQACPNQCVRRGRTKCIVVSGQSVVLRQERGKFHGAQEQKKNKSKEAALVHKATPDIVRCLCRPFMPHAASLPRPDSSHCNQIRESDICFTFAIRFTTAIFIGRGVMLDEVANFIYHNWLWERE